MCQKPSASPSDRNRLSSCPNEEWRCGRTNTHSGRPEPAPKQGRGPGTPSHPARASAPSKQFLRPASLRSSRTSGESNKRFPRQTLALVSPPQPHTGPAFLRLRSSPQTRVLELHPQGEPALELVCGVLGASCGAVGI